MQTGESEHAKIRIFYLPKAIFRLLFDFLSLQAAVPEQLFVRKTNANHFFFRKNWLIKKNRLLLQRN